MYGPFYSTKTAVGLVMATGTVGQYLQEGDQINTYLSRDAGLRWYEVAKGSHIYEFGDHGGLLVMADDIHFTNVVQYSWNYGKSWSTIQISEEKFQIENIIIEPSATSRVFIVYGWQESSGVMVYLDFTDLHTRICTGFDAPSDSSSVDYELWTPSDSRLSKCVMGHKVTYTRRKADRECYNPEITEHIQSIEPCVCTKEDFECDFGYERAESTDETGETAFNGPCIPMKEKSEHFDPQSGKECSNGRATYEISKGYRRVAGDVCLGGAEWAPEEHKCAFFGSKNTLAQVAFYILIMIVIGFFCVQCEKKIHGTDWVTKKIRQWSGWSSVPLDESFRTQDDEDEQSSFLNEEEFAKEPNTVPDGGKKRKETEIKPISKDTRINIPSIPQSRSSNNEEDFNPRGNS